MSGASPQVARPLRSILLKVDLFAGEGDVGWDLELHEVGGEGHGGFLLPVNHEDILEPGNVLNVGRHFVAIGVGGAAVHLFDSAAQAKLLAVNADLGFTLQNFASEGVLGLVADDQDRVATLGDSVLEVVQDAAALAHA